MAVARPSPIAVICSSWSTGRPFASKETLGTCTPLRTCSSTSWSAVSGARVDAKPPNVTSPMRSSGRASTNFANSSLTTSRRVFSVRAPRGVKSSASMEPLTSTVMAIAIASTLREPCASDVRGRAAATTSETAPARNSHGARLATRARQPAVFAGRRRTGANLMPARRPRRSIRHAANASGTNRRKQRGQAKPKFISHLPSVAGRRRSGSSAPSPWRRPPSRASPRGPRTSRGPRTAETPSAP